MATSTSDNEEFEGSADEYREYMVRLNDITIKLALEPTTIAKVFFLRHHLNQIKTGDDSGRQFRMGHHYNTYIHEVESLLAYNKGLLNFEYEAGAPSDRALSAEYSAEDIAAHPRVQDLHEGGVRRVDGLINRLLEPKISPEDYEILLAESFQTCPHYERKALIESVLSKCRELDKWPRFPTFRQNTKDLFQTTNRQRYRELTRQFAALLGNIDLQDELRYWSYLEARNPAQADGPDTHGIDSDFGAEIRRNIERIGFAIKNHAVGSAPIKVSPQPEGRIKWLWNERAFIRLVSLLCKEGAIRYLNEDNEIPWAEICKHFVRQDGSEFKPAQLANEASKSKHLRITDGDKIANILDELKRENTAKTLKPKAKSK